MDGMREFAGFKNNANKTELKTNCFENLITVVTTMLE